MNNISGAFSDPYQTAQMYSQENVSHETQPEGVSQDTQQANQDQAFEGKSAEARVARNRRDALKQQAGEASKQFRMKAFFPSRLVELNGVKAGVASFVGFKREAMEDRDLATNCTVVVNGKEQEFPLLGVFDGHGGEEVALFLQQKLPDYLTQELEEKNHEAFTEQGIFDALKETFKKIDDAARYDGGSTAVIGSVLNGRLRVANVGDSRCVLVKIGGKIMQASEDAKPHLDRYRRKIQQLGGDVYGGRVMGSLAIARAVGDHFLENEYGNEVKPYLLPNPKITDYGLEEFDYAVLMSDGIPEVASTQQIGEAIQEMDQQGLDVQSMADKLVLSAAMSGSTDNLTAIVIKKV